VRIVADRPDAAPNPPLADSDVITIELQRDPPANPTAQSCATADPAAWVAYAVVSGVDPDALAGTQFLVDSRGWLRARWRPGDSIDSKTPLAEIRANPLAARAERGHLHQE
jgi:hypothetical protein